MFLVYACVNQVHNESVVCGNLLRKDSRLAASHAWETIVAGT